MGDVIYSAGIGSKSNAPDQLLALEGIKVVVA